MKRLAHITLAILFICIACQRNDATLIGTWKAEKVAVDFDERYSTPEIVKQIGTLEKENFIIFSADSMLNIVNQGDTIKGNFSVRETRIMLNGKPFGTLAENSITTIETTPFGNITITYQKVQ